jgi:putative SOS response-associated peptidase YedK
MKDGLPYALAGLWERSKDRNTNTELLPFTVITTDPSELVEPMHDRMPVIIAAKDYDHWLKAPPDRLPIDLLRPFDADKMTAWKVHKAVGNVQNERPELIEPATSSEPSEDDSPETPGLLLGY